VRVVGGKFKGRRLASFKGDGIRPTTDKVREAIFNVLSVPFTYRKVLDLFAGTGALGIEALSRGAEEATFVDKSQESCKVIKDNLNTCKIEEGTRVLKKDSLEAVRSLKDGEGFDLVFMDAPYGDLEVTKKVLNALGLSKALSSDSLIVCEVSSKEVLAEDFFKENRLGLIKEKKYGDSAVYFLEKN